jgi:uncharacterized protein
LSRFIFLSILLLVIDLLAFQALKSIVGSSGRIVRIASYVIYWSIPLVTLLYLIGFAAGWSEQFPKGIKLTLRSLIFIFYFAKLLVAAIILVDDLRRLIFGALNFGFKEWKLSTERSQWMAYIGLILGAIPILSLTYGMARNPYRYQLLKNRIPVKNLHPDLAGLKIIQISDIHSGSFLLKEPVERSIQIINDQNPDIVFFTGDLVNARAVEMEPFVEMFSKIRAPLGVYSILGNHDYGDYHPWPDPSHKVQNFEDLKSIHKKLGWELLLNEHRQISVKETAINVIGVENYSAHPRFPKYGDLHKATNGMNGTGFNILLSHDPSHWEDQVIKNHKNIHLTLSGHTHGFQFGVEIPGLIKWSPIQYVYKHWAGLYESEAQYLYVNRGLGYLGYPGRVGILPEITLLTLEAV